jgi:hypothetical protein
MSTGEVMQINGKRVASPEYRSWQMMKDRCSNPTNKDFWRYGGAGITFDPAWAEFDVFLEDMGRRPRLTDTLERVNNEEGYTKTNCKWASRLEQSRNRAYVRLNQEAITAIHWEWPHVSQITLAARYGVSQSRISQVCRFAGCSGMEVGHD